MVQTVAQHTINITSQYRQRGVGGQQLLGLGRGGSTVADPGGGRVNSCWSGGGGYVNSCWLGGGGQQLLVRGRGGSKAQGGSSTLPSHLDRMTDACENITFAHTTYMVSKN